MCDPISIGIGGLVLGGAGAAQQAVAAKRADKRSKQATAQAKENSENALKQQEREINRANAKTPNVAALLQNNRLAGANQTSLSGASGVNPSALQLGQNTLLGN